MYGTSSSQHWGKRVSSLLLEFPQALPSISWPPRMTPSANPPSETKTVLSNYKQSLIILSLNFELNLSRFQLNVTISYGLSGTKFSKNPTRVCREKCLTILRVRNVRSEDWTMIFVCCVRRIPTG